MVLNVTVSAANQIPWAETANEVIVTTTTGQIGILSGHAAMATTVDIGLLLIKTTKNEWVPLICYSGIAVVNNNDLQILVNGYETLTKTTEQNAEEELKEALNNLSEIPSNNITDKVLISQKVKVASSKFLAMQIVNKKKVPFN